MEQVYVSYPSLDENKRHGAQQAGTQSETTQDKLIISNERPWKPWRSARSRIRGWAIRVQNAMLCLAGLEWYCYAALGVLMALMSFVMDLTVAKLLRAHHWLYSCLEGHKLLQFLCWTLYPACLCALSTSFSHSICPQSAGSGLPEMRAILSGVQLPDYLSLSNLFAKLVGLICTLSAGSSVFLGKVGPFVHLSNMVGAYLHRMYASACGTKQRRTQGDMLVVASAVGVASCFGAPISGVLFSIEVMGSHYSVRDYCPCFFAAVCGALSYRLLAVCSGEQETVNALFKTRFPTEIPYQPPEILFFALLGLLCGAVSCVYLFSHRWILRFVRANKLISRFIATEKTLYSGFVVFLLALVTFPYSAGSSMASQLTMRQLISSLLESTQWNSISHNATLLEESQQSLWQEWSPPGSSVYKTLGCFLIIKLWLLVLACTLPLPAGYFMPVFIYGAALGRFLGEGLVYLFPNGISPDTLSVINPGGYALVGAAAFAGAVTHTLSPALCALEMTGQSTHVVPILIATLISNAVSRSKHQPSFYDGISLIKKLPHLPSLIRACPKLSSVQIGRFVAPAGAVLQRGEKMAGVQNVLNNSTESQFPVVDTHESPTLLGTVTRDQLQAFLLEIQTEVLCKSLEDVCHIKPATLQLSPETTVKQVHCIMSVVREQRVFVTENGKLCGLITWKEMKSMIEELAEEI
ncbi:chloride channel protein ClC-Ka isoform X1 [Astyanax mexicanus]|uniref:Chloride channel protein ClC-Ka isoform X1 n=1 Tax=Astyanax mexicanus TaxID=7994 RepID=A0A8B9LSE7_ASTMX|nr:chloride channel protein ClC-Ka isoform X1 [Astyanax mexicanus]